MTTIDIDDIKFVEDFLNARALVQGRILTKKKAAERLKISIYMYRKYEKLYESVTLADLIK